MYILWIRYHFPQTSKNIVKLRHIFMYYLRSTWYVHKIFWSFYVTLMFGMPSIIISKKKLITPNDNEFSSKSNSSSLCSFKIWCGYITVWPEPIWIKVKKSLLLPQYQSTYSRGPDSVSIKSPLSDLKVS